MSQGYYSYLENKNARYSPGFQTSDLIFKNKNNNQVKKPPKRNVILKKDAWKTIKADGNAINEIDEFFPNKRKLHGQEKNNGELIDTKMESLYNISFHNKYENYGNNSLQTSEKESSHKSEQSRHINSKRAYFSPMTNLETIQYSDSFEKRKRAEALKKEFGNSDKNMYSSTEKFEKTWAIFSKIRKQAMIIIWTDSSKNKEFKMNT